MGHLHCEAAQDVCEASTPWKFTINIVVGQFVDHRVEVEPWSHTAPFGGWICHGDRAWQCANFALASKFLCSNQLDPGTDLCAVKNFLYMLVIEADAPVRGTTTNFPSVMGSMYPIVLPRQVECPGAQWV